MKLYNLYQKAKKVSLKSFFLDDKVISILKDIYIFNCISIQDFIKLRK